MRTLFFVLLMAFAFKANAQTGIGEIVGTTNPSHSQFEFYTPEKMAITWEYGDGQIARGKDVGPIIELPIKNQTYHEVKQTVVLLESQGWRVLKSVRRYEGGICTMYCVLLIR